MTHILGLLCLINVDASGKVPLGKVKKSAKKLKTAAQDVSLRVLSETKVRCESYMSHTV